LVFFLAICKEKKGNYNMLGFPFKIYNMDFGSLISFLKLILYSHIKIVVEYE